MDLRIAVSVIAACAGAAGIGRYAASVAQSLVSHGDGIEPVLLARPDWPFAREELPPRAHVVACRPTGPLWEQFQLPGILERYGVDLYHSPLFLAPIARACRQIVTLHDVIPDKFPDQTPADFLRLYRRYRDPCLRAADAVLTVSEYSKADILKTLDLGDREVHVAYQALSEQFSVERAEADRDTVRGKLSLPGRFVLYVGSIEPRKNTLALIDALGLVAERQEDVWLLLAGRRLFDEYDPMAYARSRGLSGRVRYLGYVDDEDLPGLYGAASVVAFPSSYEGFGLPVAEAMACGCPVVTSPNSSLPEAGGDAAAYADPEDAEAFAEAIRGLLEDASERDRRVEAGLAHVQQFTRERFAERLSAIYRQVLEGDQL